MEKQILLHFLKLSIRSKSYSDLPELDQFYFSNDLTDFFPKKVRQLDLHLEKADSAHRLPLGPMSGGVFAETTFCYERCYYRDPVFYSSSQGELWHEIEYDAGQHSIRVNVDGTLASCNRALFNRIIRAVLQSFILPFYSLKSLHGALLAKGGRAFFISGPGRAGKSTTSVRLMQAGYDLLADDGPWFTYQDGEAYALASLDYIHVTENTLRMFPWLQPHVIGRTESRDEYGRHKLAVSRRGLGLSAAARRPHKLTHFLMIERGQVDEPQLTPLDTKAVLQRFVNENMMVFRNPAFHSSARPIFADYSQYILQLITEVLRNVRPYKLEFADRHVEQLPDLFDEIP